MYERIILDFEEEKKVLFEERIIEREFLNYAKEFLGKGPALVITGIRRCGKSVFSHLLLRDLDYYYFNFDDERLSGIDIKELDKLFSEAIQVLGDRKAIFLDEIQNVSGWELFVNRLLRKRFIVVISGSNAKLLSKEYGTYLTGRHVDLVLFPFSFREFLRYKGFKIKKYYSTSELSKILRLLREYIERGGMPENYKFSRWKEYYRSLYRDILFKDVILRTKIRDEMDLLRVSRYLMDNFSRYITFEGIRRKLNIGSSHTVKNYVKALQDAYLFFLIKKFSYKISERETGPFKVYSIDTGFLSSISFFEIDRFSNYMENLVAIELLRRSSLKGFDVYYYKDRVGREIDFVIVRKDKILKTIQVTYAESSDDIKKREVENLNLLRSKEKIVITWEYEDEKDGIKFVPLWKFLHYNANFL